MMYFVDGAELMVETDSPALNVYKYIEFHCRWISLSYYNRMPLLQQASLWHFFPPEYSTINNQQSAERYSDKPAWYKNLNPFFIYWLKVYSPYLEQSEYRNTGNCVLVHLKNKRKQKTHTHTHKNLKSHQNEGMRNTYILLGKKIASDYFHRPHFFLDVVLTDKQALLTWFITVL